MTVVVMCSSIGKYLLILENYKFATGELHPQPFPQPLVTFTASFKEGQGVICSDNH